MFHQYHRLQVNARHPCYVFFFIKVKDILIAHNLRKLFRKCASCQLSTLLPVAMRGSGSLEAFPPNGGDLANLGLPPRQSHLPPPPPLVSPNPSTPVHLLWQIKTVGEKFTWALSPRAIMTWRTLQHKNLPVSFDFWGNG